MIKFCKTIYSSSLQKECLSLNAFYLEPKAVKICSDLYSDTNRLKCIKAIANKVYADEEISTIADMYSDSGKIESFAKFGANIVGVISTKQSQN